MGTVFREFGDAKADIENLNPNCQIKLESSEIFKRAHNEHVINNQEASSKTEKLSQELNEKAEELFLAKEMSEELKSNLKEKEALIKQLATVNDKLRADCKEKIQMHEEENKGLALALEEANQMLEELGSNLKEKDALVKHLTAVNDKFRAECKEKLQILDEQNKGLALALDEANQMYEELKLNLKQKDALVKHLTAVNDKLRADCKEKLQICEEENKGLALALEEVNAKNREQEQHVQSLKEEIDGLKGIVSVSQNKRSEADRKAKASKEIRQREDVLLKLEDEKIKYENQLKWKKEQFSHLEEAHQKLRSQFQVSEKEWEIEKASLLNELSTLQEKLDSQIRISESLQSRLKMCNQALAHEERKRKSLEVQLSESKTRFDSVFAGYEDANSRIEILTSQRDKEIASLRNSLGTRESLYKEMEYQVRVLEQDKQELLLSLKEFQESQIRDGGNSSSLAKLRNKLRCLEQVHKDCSARLKAKESEWSSEFEILTDKFSCCCTESERKTELIDQLKMKAEARDSMMVELALHNEEAALMLLMLKSEFAEAQLKLAGAYAHIDQENKESSKESRYLLVKQLEMKGSALIQAQKDVEKERKKVVQLSMKVESMDFTEEQELSLSKELEKKQKELTESYVCQCELKKQVLSMESKLSEVCNALSRTNQELDEKFCDGNEVDLELQIWKSIAQQLKTNLEEDHHKHRELEASLYAQVLSLKSQLKKLRRAMDRANEELAEKFCEGNEAEFELQIWKSITEQLKIKLEGNYQMRREVEASLLAQIALEVNLKQEKDNLLSLLEEKDQRIDDLQQELISSNKLMRTRERRGLTPASTDDAKLYGSEQGSPLQNAKENTEDSQEEEEWMKKELEAASLAQVDEEKIYDNEKESLHQLVEERDQRIENLQLLVKSLEEEFESSTSSFSSRLTEMQLEINLFREAWDKIATAVVLKEIEIQVKNLIVKEMESYLTALEADLQASKSKVERLTCEREKDLSRSDILVEKFNAEKVKTLEEVVKLSSDRENLLGTLGGLSDRLQELSVEDMQLMESLENTMQTFDCSEL